MPARVAVWTAPEDEAQELVEELIKINAPKPTIERAERLLFWTSETRQTMHHLHTLSHGGRFCDTALTQARQAIDSAAWAKSRLNRLRRE